MKASLHTYLLAATSLLGFGAPALGQDVIPAPRPGPATSPAGSDPTSLQEIVVTASKRSENINKVGMSITALNATQLSDRRIMSLQDLASAVPGLVYAQSTTNTPIFTLRGIGFNESSLGVYPAVSIYLDQSPLPFPVLASHANYDLERVEVLKGPQGTLFGENSTGGAVNYIAAKPTKYFASGGDITYGRFNEADANVYVSGPITNTLAFRIAATTHHLDDWQYSYTRDDTNGHQSYSAGRLLLAWRPSPAANVSLNVNGWVDTSQSQAQQLIALRPAAAAYATPKYLAQQFAPSNPRAADWSDTVLDPATGVTDPATGYSNPSTWKTTDFRPYSDRNFFQASLRADINLTSDITLTSLTTYEDFHQRQRTDGDGSPLVDFDLTQDKGSIQSVNQELRVANNDQSALRWLAGASVENSTTVEQQTLRYFDSPSYNPANLYINGTITNNKQDIQNYAAFGSLEYGFHNGLTLKASARYTESDTRADICSATAPNGNVDKLFNILGKLLGTVPFTPITESSCYTLNYQGVPGQPFIDSLNERNFSWRGEADYQVTSRAMLYGSISRGYKAGSFPELAPASFTSLQPVTQESVTAYEVGLKDRMFDDRVNLTGAVFYYDYRNKQERGKLLDPVFGTLDGLINIPKSSILGAEAELTVRPLDGLTLDAAVTYLDSEILRSPLPPRNTNILGMPSDFHGDPLPYTPKWTGIVNIDYRRDTGHGKPFVGISINTRSDADAQPGAHNITYVPSGAASLVILKPGVTHPLVIDGYTTVDARVGYEAENGGWQVSLWGKNIFDKYYWTSVISSNDSAARLAGMPATYGVTFAFKLQ